jgi:hypothetical protein
MGRETRPQLDDACTPCPTIDYGLSPLDKRTLHSVRLRICFGRQFTQCSEVVSSLLSASEILFYGRR